ncbi:MAG: leucine-rich repeat domain-containing protein [Promethearchaeota archaeon]
MTISENELEALEIFKKTIGESILEFPQLERYSLGYSVEEEHVTGLSLFSCGLQTIPKEIEIFTSLKKIFVRGNNLNTITEELFSLPSLEILDLSENQLTELPKSINLLSSLKELHLESNQLNCLPETIGSLSSLEILDISENKIRSVPNTIGRIQKLKTTKFKYSLKKEIAWEE